jgi:hypothetical protein
MAKVCGEPLLSACVITTLPSVVVSMTVASCIAASVWMVSVEVVGLGKSDKPPLNTDTSSISLTNIDKVVSTLLLGFIFVQTVMLEKVDFVCMFK